MTQSEIKIDLTLYPSQIKDVTLYDDVMIIRTHRGVKVRTMTVEHTPQMLSFIRDAKVTFMDHRSAGTDKK